MDEINIEMIEGIAKRGISLCMGLSHLNVFIIYLSHNHHLSLLNQFNANISTCKCEIESVKYMYTLYYVKKTLNFSHKLQ